MALRVLLVSLVASMGFELPSGQDVQSWTNQGSQWVNARVADLSHLKGEAERAFVGESDTKPIVQTEPAATKDVVSLYDDLSFDAVVEEMTTNFVADLALQEPAKPVAEVACVVPPMPVPEVVPVEVAKSVETPVVAIETSTESAQPSCFVPVVEKREGDAVALEDLDTPPIVTAEGPSTAEKLSSAVRLTKQAIDAWTSLIPTPIPTDRIADPDQQDAF